LDDDRVPIEAFHADLRKAILKWRKEGDSILIGMDLNGDVGDRSVMDFFSELSMREVLTERHGEAPETYSDGSHLVEGIFASRNIEVSSGGLFGVWRDPGY
jgi:hypothetical protein